MESPAGPIAMDYDAGGYGVRKPARRTWEEGGRAVVPIVLLLTVTALWNGHLIQQADRDRSWDALGIAIYYGPVTNLAIAAFFTMTALVLFKLAGRGWAWVVMGLAIGVPGLAAVVDLVFVLTMSNVHGC